MPHILLRLKDYRSQNSIHTLGEVLQVFRLSPTLFNVFMDTYIRFMNTVTSPYLSILLLDEVWILNQNMNIMEESLRIAPR